MKQPYFIVVVAHSLHGRLRDAKVAHYSARTVTATCAETVYLELDGEMVGTMPADFAVLPGSLKLRY